MSELTRIIWLEKRVKQLEKDVQGMTAILSKLLIWKKNHTMRTLPVTQPYKAPEEKEEKEV